VIFLVDSDIVSVVDFEHALAAPGEYDYWRLALPQFEGPDEIDDAIPRAFREAYESVHPIPPGFDRRRNLYWLLNFVSYLESLYLQKNVDSEDRAEYADWHQDIISDLLKEMREETG